MKRISYSFYPLIVMLSLTGCGMSKLDNIKWDKTERDMKTYYQDDAQCLKQANNILFRQLKSTEAKRTRKKSLARISDKDFSSQVCKSNNQRDRIHYDCMIKKGWALEKNK